MQEALTNVRKHAGGARAAVRVGYGERVLDVEVVDDGRGARTNGGGGVGHGLVGMRERVALYGGTLETGTGPDGGFRVHATLPFREGAA